MIMYADGVTINWNVGADRNKKGMSFMIKAKKKEKFNPKEARLDYLDKIENDLERKGVIFFDEKRLNIEQDLLTLPYDLTDLPAKEIGDYLNAFTQQKMYLRTLLGRVELIVEEKRRLYINVCDPHYRNFSQNTKLSETSKDKLINGLKEVKPYYDDFMDFKNKIKIITYAIQNIEDAIFLLSREVTRRNSDFEIENRNYNVGGR